MQESYYNGLIKDQFPIMVNIRREIHRFPELGMETVKTADLVESQAKELGLLSRRFGNGVIVDIGSDPEIALRADMDALPIQEATNVPFRSQIPGRMHACGHDMHTAILLGIMPIIKKLEIPVRLIFQPGEEIGKGALHMIKAGALQNIKFIFGLHAWTSLEPGEYHIVKGGAMAAVDNFNIRIHGTGGHAAYPHLSFDTIAEAGRLINRILEIPARRINPMDPAVVSIGYIMGGTANNVIPAEVQMGGTARSLKEEVSEKLKFEIESLSSEHVEVKYEKELPVLKNDIEYAYAIDKEIKEKVIEKQVPPTMGGEDFAYYCGHARCSFAFLGTGKINGVEVSKHSSHFDIHEESMIYGARLHLAAIFAASNMMHK